jgi:hypothetical protein
MGLRIHKVADRSDGRGAPWPLAGVRLLDPPEQTQVPTHVVAAGIAEGWIVGEGGRVVERPSGATPDDLFAPAHRFVHFDRLTFKTLDGDLAYAVSHQPDKYADYSEATYPDRVEAFDADDETPVTPEVYTAGATRVDWFYIIVKES